MNEVNQLVNFKKRQGGSNLIFNNPNASQMPDINKQGGASGSIDPKAKDLVALVNLQP